MNTDFHLNFSVLLLLFVFDPELSSTPTSYDYMCLFSDFFFKCFSAAVRALHGKYVVVFELEEIFRNFNTLLKYQINFHCFLSYSTSSQFGYGYSSRFFKYSIIPCSSSDSSLPFQLSIIMYASRISTSSNTSP